MIIWDSEVQPPEGRKPPYTPSIVAWYNTMTMQDSDEIKVNYYPDFDEFVHEAWDDPVHVGWNVLTFDVKNFEVHSPMPPSYTRLKTFDILWFLVEQVTGTLYQRPKGLDLDSVAQATLGRGKIKLDVPAAQLYAAGIFDMLELYVKTDVALTKDILFFMLAMDYVRYPKKTNGAEIYEDIDCYNAREWIDRIESKNMVGW